MIDTRITVTFTKDFPLYEMKEGQSRKVSLEVAKRLFLFYHAIENPFPSPMVTVKPIEDIEAFGWKAYQEYLVPYEIAKSMLKAGTAYATESLPEESKPEKHIAHAEPAPGNTDFTKWYGWFKSHPTWNGEIEGFALRCIELCSQEGEEFAKSVLDGWVESGELCRENGIISWDTGLKG